MPPGPKSKGCKWNEYPGECTGTPEQLFTNSYYL